MEHVSSRHQTVRQVCISSIVLPQWYRADSSYNTGILEDQSAEQVRLDVKLITQMSAIAPSPILSLYELEKNGESFL